MADVASVIAELQKYNMNSAWLSGWLDKLPADEQKAAVDAIQKKLDNKDVSGIGDIQTAASEAVNKHRIGVTVKKDPSKLLYVSGHPEAATKLKAYFDSDKYLKNNPDAQAKVMGAALRAVTRGEDPIAAAESANWQNLSTRDRYKYYGAQEGDLKNLDVVKSQFSESDWSGIEDYLKKLKSPADRYVALQHINQAVKDNAAFHHLDTKKLYSELPDVVNPPAKVDKAVDQSADSAAATAQPQGAAAAMQLVPQPGDTQVTAAQKQLYKDATGGQDFDTAYQNFIKNYGVAIRQQNAVTGAEQGSSQLWTTGAYQPLAAGYTYGTPQPIAAGDAHHQVSPAQFLGMQANSSLKLATSALQAAQSMWAANHITTMPQGAAQAVVQKISQMSPSNQALLASDPQGLQSPSLGLGNILTDYAAKHPEEAPASGSDDETYQLNLKRGASPLPGYADLGQYDAVAKKMDTLWSTYFHREPTETEQKYFGGWNPDEIEGWVLSQQSPDNPNMTIGERQGFINAGNKASMELFGTGIDSRMVDLMDGHFNPKQAPPPKPNMSLQPAPTTNPSTTFANGAAKK